MANEFNLDDYLTSLVQGGQQQPDTPPPVETDAFDLDSYLESQVAPTAAREATEIPGEFLPGEQPAFERPEDADEQEKLTFAQLSGDEDYMDMLREYQKDRFGDSGVQGENETNEEYLKKFLSQTREFEWNSIDLGRQLDWVRGADDEQRMKFGYLYSQLDKLPSFYEEGGTGGASAMRDFGKALLLDPLNYIGFGAGKVAGFAATRGIVTALKQTGKKAAIEQAAKELAKRNIKKAGKIGAFGAGVEALAFGVQDLKQQELDILSQRYGEATPEEKSYLQAAITGGAGLVVGAGMARLGAKKLTADKLIQNGQETLNKQKKLRDELVSRNKKLTGKAGDRADEAADLANGVFDVEAGREILDALGPEPSKADFMAQMQFRTELMQRVGKVVTEVVRDIADTGELGKMVDADTKASEVIGKIVRDSMQAAEGKSTQEIQDQTIKMLMGDKASKGALDELGDIDPDILEAAMSRAGLTPKQFVDAMGASYSDAGKYLQTASNVGKIMRGLSKLDPDLEKILMDHAGSDKQIGLLGKAHEGMKRLDRERRALMVTQIGTTVRNVASAGLRLGMETPASIMESMLYQTGKIFDAASSGTLSKETFKTSYKDLIRDSFGSLDRMRQAGATADLSDLLLRHNTQLAHRMDRSLQEVGVDESLSRVTTMLNGLNIAQDMFFRKAIFVDTIDKRMRRAGIIVDNPTKVGQYASIDEFVASGKSLPTKFLQAAVEDSLAFTFARMPKAGGSKAGDTIGHHFIKFNEALGPIPGPVGTAAFPFSKFMVNALQFQFQYSPLSVANSVFTTGKAMAKKRKALADAAKGVEGAEEGITEASKAFQKAREDFSKGVVGTAALMAAIKHRAENQDVKWYEAKNDDGTTSDLRPFFPMTPYLAFADLIVKMGGTEVGTLGLVDAPEKVGEINAKEFLEGFTGAQFRTGASAALLENFFEALSNEKAPTNARLAEMAGEHIAEVFGGFATPLRVVRDVKAAYDVEAAVVRDTRQTEGIGGVDRFTSALTNKLMAEVPGLAEQLPEKESGTRAGPILRQSPLIGQVTGLRREAKRNPAEQELVRLGYKTWAMVPGSGDKTADALVTKYMGSEVERRIGELVQSESYQNKTDNQKRAAINNYLKLSRKKSKQLAKIEAAKDKEEPFTVFDRAQFSRLSKLQRKLVDEYYTENYGMTVEEKQENEPEINHLKRASRLARVLAKNQI